MSSKSSAILVITAIVSLLETAYQDIAIAFCILRVLFFQIFPFSYAMSSKMILCRGRCFRILNFLGKCGALYKTIFKVISAVYLENNKSLNCEHLSLLDYAIFPFVRQFRNVDQEWFDKLNFIFLNKWINQIIDSKDFSSIMKKFKKWEPNDVPIYTYFE